MWVSLIMTRKATKDEILEMYLNAVPLGQPPIPEDNPGLRRLHAHTLATDPDRFRVVEDAQGHELARGLFPQELGRIESTLRRFETVP